MTTTKKSSAETNDLPEGAAKEPEKAPTDITPIPAAGASEAPAPPVRPLDYQYDDPSTFPVVTMPPASNVGTLGEG